MSLDNCGGNNIIFSVFFHRLFLNVCNQGTAAFLSKGQLGINKKVKLNYSSKKRHMLALTLQDMTWQLTILTLLIAQASTSSVTGQITDTLVFQGAGGRWRSGTGQCHQIQYLTHRSASESSTPGVPGPAPICRDRWDGLPRENDADEEKLRTRLSSTRSVKRRRPSTRK